MLKILLEILNTQAEHILSEEKAGFRRGRNTVEQIINCRMIIEKHLGVQINLFHNFIDFKKAFVYIYIYIYMARRHGMDSVGISQDIT